MATYDLTSAIPAAETLAAGDILNCPYSGAYKTVQLPAGQYKLEVWGAQGGSFDTTYVGGKGGYSKGVLSLKELTTLHLYAGGKGTDGTTSGTFAGGWNGGGQAYTSSATYDMSAGGGGSDIRINSNSLYARVIVAGGGGGAGTYNATYRYSGGAGGGTSGIAGGGYTTTYPAGGVGTQTSAGASYYGSTNNNNPAYTTPAAFGTGGAAKSSGQVAGGGGGWYGGGATRRASGSGGSGYVYSSTTVSSYPSGCELNADYYLTDTQVTAGNASFVQYSGGTGTGHSGNGACRITVIDIALPEDPSSCDKIKVKVNEEDLSRLPTGYTEVEYIESNGTQYIDTGFIPNQDTQVTMDAQVSTTPSGNLFLFGSRTTASSNTFTLVWYNPSLYFRADYNNQQLAFSAKKISPTTRLKIDFNKNTVGLNDQTIQHTYAEFNCPVNLYLFAGNTNGSFTNPAPMKLYSCQIYDNGVLIRDYVPAIENSTRKTGLYDLINNQFYADAAGGTFGYNHKKNTSFSNRNILFSLKGDSLDEIDSYPYWLKSDNDIVISKVGRGFNTKALYFNNSYVFVDFVNTHVGDITFEAWIYQTSTTNSSYPTPYTITSDAVPEGLCAQLSTTGIFCATDSSGTISAGTAGTTKINEWIHIAQVQHGTTVYNFINGKLVSTITDIDNNSYRGVALGTLFQQGTLPRADSYWQGYMSNIIVTGEAKWLSDFEPPFYFSDETDWREVEKAYLKTETSDIEAEYTRLAYIESNSFQYIDTKLPITKDSGFEVDFQLLEIPTTTVTITGGFIWDAQNFQFVADADGIWRIYVGTGGNTSYSLGPVDTERHKIKVNNGLTGQLIFDNEEYNLYGVSLNHTVLDNTDRTFHICCANGGEGRLNYNIGSMKIYGCKYYENNTLVRDYIPVMYNVNYKIGLLNRLTGEFFADANNINFVGGFIETIDPATVLILNGQSFENQAINTNIQVTKNNGVVLSSINDGSMYFNGSSYLQLSPYEFGDADFTIDWWDCVEDVSANRGIFSSVYGTALDDAYGISLYVNTAQEMHLAIKVYADALQKETTTTTTDLAAMSNHPLKIWNHKAIIKQGNKVYATLNGKIVNQISAGNFAIYDHTYSPMVLGAYNNDGALVYFKGWIKDFRISRMARWQREFTLETITLGNPWKEINTIYIREPNPPEGYTKLEYLESAGKQYIDIGYVPNQDTRTVIDCIFPANSNSYYLFGAREESYVDNYAIQTSGNLYYSKHGTADIYLNIESVPDRMIIEKNGYSYSVNGNPGYNTPVDFTCKRSAYIFACNSAGSVYGLCPAGTRVYRCKIYDGEGNLVKDLVPMLHNINGSGLYDLVNNIFHPNAVYDAMENEDDFIYKTAPLWRKI